MKDFFPGFFPKDEAEHKTLWGQCLFVFDTNILLNMYRYSDDTRASFLQVLEKLNDRVWIPHRVADEYLTNRLKIIFEQQEEYSSAIGELQGLRKKLESTRQHPFVSTQVMERALDTFSSLEVELERNQSIHVKRMHDDEIKGHLAEIFKERVGRRLTADELEAIISDGERRYAEKIPPGYSDAKKSSAEEFLVARCRQYGDLIVWKQILEKALDDKKPIIFVTDDGKEDWWLRFKGKTIGPRPELIEEFVAKTGLDFHMYHPERFLSLASDYLKQETSIPDEILDEVRNLRVKEERQAKKIDAKAMVGAQKKERYEEISKQYEEMSKEFAQMLSRLEDLRGDIGYFDKLKKELRRDIFEFRELYDGGDIEESEGYQSYKTQYEEYSMAVNNYQKEHEHLSVRTDELRRRMKIAEHKIFDIQRQYFDFNGVTVDDL